MQDSNKIGFKQGFIFGFGLIIPLIVGYIGYNTVIYAFSKIYESGNGSNEAFELYQSKEEQNVKSIEILEFKDVREENFVMVLGSIKNTGKYKN